MRLAPVQFGLFDWIDINQLELPDLYEQRLKLLEYADTTGFYCYHLAEHHGTPLSVTPSPALFLAAAAQRTRRIRLGPLVYLLPIYNPLRLAQEICMLDNMCRGRLELGVGRGISPIELSFFKVDSQESRAMFQEALEIMTKGLATGKISCEGRYYSFRDMPIHMKPFQRPYPPLWYPTDNPESMTWLARHGMSTVTHNKPMTTVRELFDLYKRVWEEHREEQNRLNGHVPDPKYGMLRHIYLAQTDGEAVKEAKRAFADFNKNFSYLRSQGGDTKMKDYLADVDARLAEGLYIFGSPATVRATIKEQLDITGANYFLGAFSFGTLTTEQILDSMRLFAEEVMPAFHGD